MVYYELLEGKAPNGLPSILRARKQHGSIIPESELQTHARPHEAYVSLFGYGKEILSHTALHNGSVSGFAGPFYAHQIVIDIDNADDPEQARQSAIALLRRLHDYGCPVDAPRIYFSGAKGFHICLPEALFGRLRHGMDMPQKMKAYVEALTHGLPNIDTGIYNPNRLIRLPLSRHAGTGLYKTPLHAHELLEMPMNHIRVMAHEPRDTFRPKMPVTDMVKVRGLVEVESLKLKVKSSSSSGALSFTDKNTQAKGESAPAQSSNLQIFESSNSTQNAFFSPPPKGKRNDTFYKQALRLFAHSELGYGEVLQLLANTNLAAQEPLPADELHRTVQSAKKFAESRLAKDLAQEEARLDLFAGLIPGWVEYVHNRSRQFSLLFPELDEDLRSSEGKLIAILGKGGARKSLFAMNILLHNLPQGARGIYSNMEMSNLQLMNRCIDWMGRGREANASFELELEELKEAGKGRRILEEHIAPDMADHFLFLDHSAMTAADYDKVLEECTRRHGRVHFLVVDGLSMMGGTGSESDRYAGHTRALKELSKKWGVCILLLCHVTKEAGRETRNLTRYVRGSEKILDNCDCVISLSLCADALTLSQPEPQYLPTRGYMHYWNKRGSGRELSAIYELDTIRLRITPAPESPETYEYTRKNSKHENPFLP